jgi:hypothetical protein
MERLHLPRSGDPVNPADHYEKFSFFFCTLTDRDLPQT